MRRKIRIDEDHIGQKPSSKPMPRGLTNCPRCSLPIARTTLDFHLRKCRGERESQFEEMEQAVRSNWSKRGGSRPEWRDVTSPDSDEDSISAWAVNSETLEKDIAAVMSMHMSDHHKKQVFSSLMEEAARYKWDDFPKERERERERDQERDTWNERELGRDKWKERERENEGGGGRERSFFGAFSNVPNGRRDKERETAAEREKREREERETREKREKEREERERRERSKPYVASESEDTSDDSYTQDFEAMMRNKFGRERDNVAARTKRESEEREKRAKEESIRAEQRQREEAARKQRERETQRERDSQRERERERQKKEEEEARKREAAQRVGTFSLSVNILEAFKEFDAKTEGKKIIKFSDFPFPHSLSGPDPLKIKDDKSVKLYHALLRVLHPDKFMAKYGKKISEPELNITLAKVKEICQYVTTKFSQNNQY